jgi:hypothetical protein
VRWNSVQYLIRGAVAVAWNDDDAASVVAGSGCECVDVLAVELAKNEFAKRRTLVLERNQRAAGDRVAAISWA